MWGIIMKSITIHSLDDELDRKIRLIASKEGQSLNKTIKKILRHALGLDEQHTLARREQFKDFLGVWSHKDLKEFQESTSDFSTIDQEDWQ